MTVSATLVGVLLKGVAASRPAANAVAGGTVYSATDTGAITQSDGTSWSTFATISTGLADPMTTRGDIIVRNAANATARLGIGSAGKVLSSDGTDPSWQTPPGGSSVSTVDQDIGADFTTASDSAWHDITGLTGIALTAGTWIGHVDIELMAGGNLGPVFRIWDGTTTYAQMGWIQGTPPAAVSSHHAFNSKPFVLGGSATMVIQVYSDTAFTIKKYPTRGGLSTSVATHVTFMKIA